jgi:uncharacterized protein
MKMVRVGEVLVLSIYIFMLTVATTFAFDVPVRPHNYVNDYARILSLSETEHLNKLLYDFQRRTSHQLIIVTIPSLDNEPIENYAIKLADKWKIGTSQHNNRAILLLSKAENKIRIEVGYGLEGVLTHTMAEQIIQNEMRPAMRSGNFDLGIDRGVVAIMQAANNEYPPSNSKSSSSDIFLTAGILMMIILLPLLGIIGWLRT